MENRYIDALVAIKVMGWVNKENGLWVNSEGKSYQDIYNKYPIYPPNYSSDISAAWQVAEMLEQRFECTVNIQIRPRRGGRDKVWTGERWEHKRYAATVEGGELGYDNFNCSFTIYDHSPSVAICLATLKAVGVEVEETEARDVRHLRP